MTMTMAMTKKASDSCFWFFIQCFKTNEKRHLTATLHLKIDWGKEQFQELSCPFRVASAKMSHGLKKRWFIFSRLFCFVRKIKRQIGLMRTWFIEASFSVLRLPRPVSFVENACDHLLSFERNRQSALKWSCWRRSSVEWIIAEIAKTVRWMFLVSWCKSTHD